MAYQHKTVTKEVSVVDEDTLFCNRCGERIVRQSCDVELCSVSVTWGYDSKGKDCQKHEWELCEACYDVFVATFVIPPKITHYM